MLLLMSKWLHGLHEGHEGGLAYYGDRPSWIVFTEEIGHDRNNLTGKDFSQWSNAGFWPVCRINNGYEPNGTIPPPDYYSNFATRIANYVSASKGCLYWIIGNEPNAMWEWPDGRQITPENYVACFKLCRSAIKNLSGHRGDVVMPAPIAPWNVQSGDWLAYFEKILKLLEPVGCDGIALHTYTHGSDPGLVTSEVKMDTSGYTDRYYNFKAYRDFLSRVPVSMKSLPVLITETDQNDPWLNQNNHWVQTAYEEIEHWNEGAGHQAIQCLSLYRFPNHDKWYMTGKNSLMNDFVASVHNGYLAVQPKVFTVPPSPSTPDQVKAKVIATILNIRKDAGAGSSLVGTLVKDDVVTILETKIAEDGALWARVGPDQWVLRSWLQPVVDTTIPNQGQDDFLRNLAFVLRWEGGWADDPHDKGGATMKGITYGKYVEWLRKTGRIKHDAGGEEILPTKEELRNIPDNWVNEIYRGIWVESGANKLSYPMNLAVFDLAVNGGTERAKELLRQCGQDFWCYMTRRKNWYKSLDDFQYFGDAWLKRTKDLIDTAYANS